MVLLAALVKGIVLGLGAAVPIGPVNLEMARRTLRSGLLVGLVVGAGMVVGDTALAMLGSVLGAKLMRADTIEHWLTWPAVLVLAALGLWSLRTGVRTWKHGVADTAGDLAATPHGRNPAMTIARAFLAGLVMTLVNPAVWIYWFTTMAAIVTHYREVSPWLGVPTVLVGVAGGGAAWVLTFNGLISRAGRFRKGWWLVAADLGGAAVLLVLAGVLMWKAMGLHL